MKGIVGEGSPLLSPVSVLGNTITSVNNGKLGIGTHLSKEVNYQKSMQRRAHA